MAGTTAPLKTVVVADDTAFVRDRFRTALEAAGHRAITLSRAVPLLDLMRGDPHQIDLLLLDLQLPDVPGADLVKTIRTLDRGRVPILIFSGTIASAGEVRALSALGVAGYVNEYSSAQHILPALAPHLFPDNFNRRGSPRVALGVPVQHRFGPTSSAALTLNIGHGGIAIRTTGPLERGSQIQITFRMPGDTRDVEAGGVVMWSDRRVGMGVQFDSLDPGAHAMINQFVDGHLFSNRKAVE